MARLIAFAALLAVVAVCVAKDHSDGEKAATHQMKQFLTRRSEYRELAAKLATKTTTKTRTTTKTTKTKTTTRTTTKKSTKTMTTTKTTTTKTTTTRTTSKTRTTTNTSTTATTATTTTATTAVGATTTSTTTTSSTTTKSTTTTSSSTTGKAASCSRGSATGPTTWYVAPPGGAPSNQCGAPGNREVPFAQIDLLRKVVGPGDTVLLLPGTYRNPRFGDGDIWKDEHTLLLWKWTGKLGQWITVKPESPGTVTVNCDSNNAVYLRECQYVRVEGLKIIGQVESIPLQYALDYQFTYKDEGGAIQRRVPLGSTPEQIEAMTLPANIYAFRPPYFSTSGLLVFGSHYIEVIGNEVGFMPGTGLRVQGGDRIVVQGNVVHDSSRRSSSGTHGFVLHSLEPVDDKDENHIIVEGNRVYSNYNEVYSWSELKNFIHPEIDEGKGITVQKTTDMWNQGKGRIAIRNNVCFDNGFAGVHVNDGARVDVFSNTLYNNFHSGRGNNVGVSFSPCGDCAAEDNIVVGENSWGGYVLQSTSNSSSFQNNIIVGQADQAALGQQGAFRAEDPLFVDAAGRDFHLQASSPAVNTGTAGLVEKDFGGNVRGDQPDVGAYEAQ